MSKYFEFTRRILLTVGFILALAFSVNSQTRTSKEIDGLVGPVHSVVTAHISYLKTDDRWVEDKTTTSPVVTYDENGNDGRLGLGENSEVGSRAGGSVKYDDKGRVIERDFYDQNNELAGKILFTYGDGGHITEVSQEDGKGRLQQRHTSTFDDKGNRTNLSTFDGDNKETRKLTWTFDAKGNQTEWTESLLKNDEMVLFERITYTYDDRNNVLVQTQYGNPEGSIMKQIFSYEFDDRGNWVRRERLLFAGDATEANGRDVDLRSITYYATGTHASRVQARRKRAYQFISALIVRFNPHVPR